jgi:hypothetical protein
MRRIVRLLLLVLVPVACTRAPEPGTSPAKDPSPPRETFFGHLGTGKIGEFEGRLPCYRDGDLMVYVPMSGYPGKPLGPAYVLITRLNLAVPFLMDGGLNVASDNLQISPAQNDSKGGPFRFKYTVNIDERGEIIRGKTPVEAFSVGGQNYKPEAGRVFLVDLNADPPTVSQVKVDVADVLAHPDQDPSLEDLKGVVEKLAGMDKAVRDFVAACNKR